MQWSNDSAPGEITSSLGSTDDGPTRRAILNENEILDGKKTLPELGGSAEFLPPKDADAIGTNREVRNERALDVYNRVEAKLTGTFYSPLEFGLMETVVPAFRSGF